MQHSIAPAPGQAGVDENARTEPAKQAGQRPTVPLPTAYLPPETRRFLEAIHPDSVFEIRILKCDDSRGFIVPADKYSKTFAGWFNQIDHATTELGKVRGVSAYVSVNPVVPDLLARANNRLRHNDKVTKDADVLVIRHLFIDIDPKRPAGISATDAERQAALSRADQILDTIPGLRECSHWGSSGNGAWIVVRLPDYPNDQAHRDLYAKAVDLLHASFSDDSVEIDANAKNVGRIMCLPGTVKCKGDSIPERPHRVATIDSLPGDRLTFDLVTWVANKAAATPPAEKPAPRLAMMPAIERKGGVADLVVRCRSYIDKMPPAIEGQNGSGALFSVACAANRFGLPRESAISLIEAAYNPRCEPPWSIGEITHKVDDAYTKHANEHGTQADSRQPQVYVGGFREHQEHQEQAKRSTPFGTEDDPRRLAKLHLAKHHAWTTGERTLVFYQGSFLNYRDSAYREVADAEISATVANTVEQEFQELYQSDLMAYGMRQATTPKVEGGGTEKGKGKDKSDKRPEKRKVTRNLVGNVRLGLEGETLLKTQDCDTPPAWLGDPPMPWDPREVLPLKNALVHLPSYIDQSDDYSIEPTPRFFSTYALDYNFDPVPPEPVNFLTFIGHHPLSDRSVVKSQIWRDGDEVDHESIATLQEWFGLQILSDTSFEKIMAWIGPMRSGKGTLAKILKALVGPDNVAGPTLGGLATQFGLEPLIGKPVAIVDDARLSGRSDQATITERFLTISGNGHLTVDRKHRASWSGRLPTRFTIISNELPRLEDASGALASRLIVLRFTKSFLGNEDRTLFERTLRPELPGILLWAINGWKRLRDRGSFLQPASGNDLVDDLRSLSSPITAFLSDCCEVGPHLSIEIDDLYNTWLDWCHSENRRHPCNKITFGRDLGAAVPGLRKGQGDKRDQNGHPEKTPEGGRIQTRYHKGLTVTKRPPPRPIHGGSATACNTLQNTARVVSSGEAF